MHPISLLLLLILLAPAVLANDTALHEGGSGPEPIGGGLKGSESVIQMVSERLTIQFGRDYTEVTARFVFKSTKKNAPARQLVGFPDLGAARAEAGRRKEATVYEGDLNGPLENLQTSINGKSVTATLRYGYIKESNDSPGWRAGKAGDTLMAWYAVPIVFPPDAEVVVERNYRAPNGSNANGQKFFEYITHTGGVWQGRIQKLVALVTLTDGLTIKDLAWKTVKTEDYLPASYPPKAEWQIQSPNQLSLTWLNFEPRADKNRSGFGIFTKSVLP